MIFFFKVTATNAGSYATHVEASDLNTAQKFISSYPHVVSWEDVTEAEIPTNVRAGLFRPLVA
jgi:hypothetical protein